MKNTTFNLFFKITGQQYACKTVLAGSNVALHQFNLRRELNLLNRTVATRIKATMSSSRKYPGAVVQIIGSKDVVIPLWCCYLIGMPPTPFNIFILGAKCRTLPFCSVVYFVGANFQQQNPSRFKTFSTNNLAVVEKAFCCLPSFGSPLTNYHSVKSDGVFSLSKAASNMQHIPLVRDPRTAKVDAIRLSAFHELGLPPDILQGMTKIEIQENIGSHRISSGSFIGM
jgi:hypothetical protein